MRRPLFVLAVVFLAALFAARRGDAHKPVTSKYTYNEHVWPILRERCGRCHVPGGVAPMSLMTYQEARAWSEAVRSALLSAHMPPSNVEIGSFRNARRLPARDLDALLTWATGGTPEGEPAASHPPLTITNAWALGAPDLELPLPAGGLGANQWESTREFSVPVGAEGERWIRAVDLRPGTPAIVRRAVIAVKLPLSKGHALATVPEHVLAIWIPGLDPAPVERGTAFRLPAGSELVVRVHYRKTWAYEGQPLTDRSTVGVYFATAPAAEVQAFTLSSPSTPPLRGGQVVFSRMVEREMTVVALTPDEALANVRLQVVAALPDGARRTLIRVHLQPYWVQRYAFAPPVTLARGTRLEVLAQLGDAEGMLPPSATEIPVKLAGGSAVRLTLDVVETGPGHTQR